MGLEENGFLNAVKAIQQAENPLEVLGIWATYSEYLAGAKMVYSHAAPVDFPIPSLYWPHNIFHEGAFRPFFAEPHLYFIDELTTERIVRGGNIKVDHSVSLDTNAASYVENFVNNQGDVPADFVKALKLIIERGLNFDYTFYLMENTSNYRNPAKATFIRQNLIALQILDSLDTELYARTNEVKSILPVSQLEALADAKLHRFYVTLQTGNQLFTYEHWNAILYVMLLKVIEIEYCRKGKVPIERKIDQLFAFMHGEMRAYFDRLTIIALKLFNKRSDISFFNPLNKGGARDRDALRNIIKGMAWDLTLLRTLDQLSAMKMGGDYFVPLFLSSDRYLLELYALHPIRASIAHGTEGQVVPLPLKDSTKEVEGIMGREFIKKYFDEEARRLRLSEVHVALDTAPARLLQMLEDRVLDCLV